MKVTIVTPSFNQGTFIERTLASVASQTGGQIEHLVFDGGSTDDTIDILKRFGSGVQWTSEKDGGQAHAVNKGLRAASGDVIGWLNSDDVYLPGAIARVVEFMEAHDEVDVVYGMADHLDVDDRAFEPYPTAPWDLELLKNTCFICQPALFLRKRVIDVHGVLDERLNFCMDYEYWLRLAKAGVRFAYLPEKLAGSRLYSTNKTLGSRIGVHREINDVMKRTYGRVPDQWLFAYAHAVVEDKMKRADNPNLFAIRVGTSALLAAIKWNHVISGAMFSTAFHWFREAVTS